jgi:hypothetical protein
MAQLKKRLTVIRVPPMTKRRAERVAHYHRCTITTFIEDLAQTTLEKNMLAQLPDDECRALYMKRKLSWERAFPDRKREPGQFRFPDPYSGPQEPIAVNLTLKSAWIFARYRDLMHDTMPYIVAKLFNNLERGILEHLNEEQKAKYFAGELQRTIPYTFDPLEQDEG